MFASQLLRILQTIPTDVKYETCVSAEQDMTMKENENAALRDSRSSDKETDPPVIERKEIYPLNGLIRDTHPSSFEVKDRDECWNPKFVDEFSMDDQNRTTDKEQSSPEHECSMTVEEITSFNENELKDSKPPYTATSDLFETDTNSYTDKNVLECDSPELMVCYKDTNYHVVKDICVDEGIFFIESSKDEWPGHSFPRPLDDDSHCEATEGAVDGVSISDGLTISSLEDVSSNELGIKEERPKSPSESSTDKDTAEDPEDLTHKGERNSGATEETLSDASAEDSFIDKTLPIQEFGTRSFLRSFISSLDGEGNKLAQPPDQKIVSEGPATSSAEAGPKEDVQANSLSYNSKVQRRSITFDFDSLSPELAGITNRETENVGLRNMLDHENPDSYNPSDSSQVDCNSSKNTSIEEINEESLKIKDMTDKNVRDDNSHDLSSDNLVESHDVLKHKRRGSENDSVVSLGKFEQGESSFCDTSFVTHAGPIPFSGSISFRSDGSATSGRSFAFPILQNEWNSSPVRMTKAEGRHFRKHKGWRRSGLLCCRF